MKLQEFMSPIINHVIKYVIISLNVNCTIVYSEQFFFCMLFLACMSLNMNHALWYVIISLYVTNDESCY